MTESDNTSALPLYLSPSQISSLLTCGEQYRLTRVLNLPERPQWASIGGSAVHRMTEDIDLAPFGLVEAVWPWEHYWNEALDEAKTRNPEFDESEYRASGRASKAWPDKENPDWWHENGPKFVESWVNWREASGLTIAEVPDLETGDLRPAIEIEVWAYGPDETPVRSIIDRVLLDQYGHWYIVDLKSGSFTDKWPRQLALNGIGLMQTYPGMFNVEDGSGYLGFWKARSGGVAHWWNMADYPEDWLFDQVTKAKAIRDQGLFVPQPNNLCDSACGVRQYCVAMGGKVDLELSLTRRKMQP